MKKTFLEHLSESGIIKNIADGVDQYGEKKQKKAMSEKKRIEELMKKKEQLDDAELKLLKAIKDNKAIIQGSEGKELDFELKKRLENVRSAKKEINDFFNVQEEKHEKGPGIVDRGVRLIKNWFSDEDDEEKEPKKTLRDGLR